MFDYTLTGYVIQIHFVSIGASGIFGDFFGSSLSALLITLDGLGNCMGFQRMEPGWPYAKASALLAVLVFQPFFRI